MIQRSIEIDPEKCAKVARLLGTSGDRDTIDTAFDRLLRREPTGVDRVFIEKVTAGRYADVLDESVTTRAWW
ncbi:hypothetical protein LX16_0923 [Stackebrandtia albiflava]|uniref:VapB protein of antitoxin of type II toxin-antitoxin system n=1 Tax=Stackebrandtia albiflava TaxID=406432 RepID=A0A562VBG5_9ACTN|nr:hypothetical protein [Stackebrandtia albiflava]TWJ15223.1 hypothetical protein LX16_0923 [Stackebrandtia albiflava]